MRKLIVTGEKIVAALFATVVVLLAFALYMGNNGIPFVEGTWKTERGSVEGFDIGMSKEEAFVILETRYASPDHFVEIHWQKGSEADVVLEEFENSRFNGGLYRTYSIAILNLHEQTLPLRVSGMWKIKLPGSWVNYIYLQLEGNRLHRITEDHWVFERP